MEGLNKKGQVTNIAPAIIALIFAGIVLIMGLVINQELRDTQVGATSLTVTNETVTMTNTTGSGTLATYSTTNGWSSWNASAVLNNSDDVTLTEGVDYQINSANGTVFNLTDTWAVDPAVFLVTYTYFYGGESFTGANSTVVGLGTFADFWEIIVLAIVISVVIGLLLTVFGGRRAR
jgi:hypothetical protein